MSSNNLYSRTPAALPASDPGEGLKLAVHLFTRGRHLLAFDLLEELLEKHPHLEVEILATAYELYQALPDKSRYSLYQARAFDFPISPGDAVLDIGSGHMPFPLATHLSDITLEDDGFGRAGMALRKIDGKPLYEFPVESIPFPDKAFDFVYCSHILEHVQNPEAACREIMRVGRRGYIETPTKGKDTFFNTAGISNHKWHLDILDGELVFTEYTAQDIRGLRCTLGQSIISQPRTQREKALSALFYLKAPLFNTMFMWDGEFAFQVRRRQAPVMKMEA